jgi:hypothetical protein
VGYPEDVDVFTVFDESGQFLHSHTNTCTEDGEKLGCLIKIKNKKKRRKENQKSVLR